ncbi:MAG: aminotransferase class IV [Saprospiraceae bacterium]|nr:aminotransferase class IV [Saprospiraceae bacterium]
MNSCLETIQIKNRRLCNIRYHNERLNRTRKIVYNCNDELSLEEIITIPADLDNNIYKCRVIYDININIIEFQPYQIKPIHSIQLVEDNDIDYHYKWLDRTRFAEHLAKTKADDILIIKNGYLSDTSYANVAFFNGQKWFTPATPLLAGTCRQRLLDEDKIIPEALQIKDLKHFHFIKLLNAMLDWEESPMLEISVLRFNP